MRIKDMPFWNRPGYKLGREKQLNDAELLAIIFERGNKESNAIDLANKLLSKYNFHTLAKMPLSKLREEVGEVRALKIRAMFEIFRKTSRLEKGGYKSSITCAEDVYNHFVDKFRLLKKEHFFCLLLDTKNKIIQEVLVSMGTLNSSVVHPREVFNPAIENSANSIILVHNHPSGDPKPSDEDRKITELLVEVGETVNIKVLDHVIIGHEDFWSYMRDS